MDDLATTLLILPCSKSKEGAAIPLLSEVRLESMLGDRARDLLLEGRDRAWRRKGVALYESSPLRPAIGYYTGRLYQAPGVRSLLLEAIRRGAHCLIISGGYGVLRAEEPIHNYNAHLPRTIDVWRPNIPTILRDYVSRQGISRTFGCFSRIYGSVLPVDLTGDDWRHIPEGPGTGPVLKELSGTWLQILRRLVPV